MAQTPSNTLSHPAIPPSSPTEETTLLRNSCRDIIKGFLKDCNIPCRTGEFDEKLFKVICDRASEQGCCLSGPLSIVPALRVGAMMGAISYAHAEFEVQVFVALYSAYLTCMDDMCARDASLVNKFVDTFILHKPQGHPVLDAYAALLLEMPKKFGRVVSDVMVISGLNMMNAWLLEAELPQMSLPPTAYTYANLIRSLSGGADAYSLYIFPRDLPCAGYIHALADINSFINFGNDILSFYKEEVVQDSSNYVSIMATLSRTSKQDVLKNLVKETAAAYNRALDTLTSNPEALEAFRSFAHGYVTFHATESRYKLSELNLGEE